MAAYWVISFGQVILIAAVGFRARRRSIDFAAAIEAGRKPLALVPDSSPDRAMYLANLGDTL